MSRSVRAHLAFVGVAVLVCLALAVAPAEAKKPASFADLPLAQLFGIKGKESGGTCVGCTLSTLHPPPPVAFVLSASGLFNLLI
jgi:hypothetical protein